MLRAKKAHKVILVLELNAGLFPNHRILQLHPRAQQENQINGNYNRQEGYCDIEQTGEGTDCVLIRNVNISVVECY